MLRRSRFPKTHTSSIVEYSLVTSTVILMFAACLTSQNVMAAQDEGTDSTSRIRHSDLSVYRAADGTPAPLRTLDDWAKRRSQIISGAEAV